MTRKAGDSIAIGEGIVVRVLEVQGGKVQLGIEAPRDVKVRSPAPTEAPRDGQEP